MYRGWRNDCSRTKFYNWAIHLVGRRNEPHRQLDRAFISGNVTEIKDALDVVKRNRKTGYAIEQTGFPLPHLSRSINSWTDEIENGRGFLVVRGFPVEMSDEAPPYDAYWGLGRNLGEAIIQIYEGRRIQKGSEPRS